jgi:hypothetical protein
MAETAAVAAAGPEAAMYAAFNAAYALTDTADGVGGRGGATLCSNMLSASANDGREAPEGRVVSFGFEPIAGCSATSWFAFVAVASSALGGSSALAGGSTATEIGASKEATTALLSSTHVAGTPLSGRSASMRDNCTARTQLTESAYLHARRTKGADDRRG